MKAVREKYSEVDVQVDGGVGLGNIADCWNAGGKFNLIQLDRPKDPHRHTLDQLLQKDRKLRSNLNFQTSISVIRCALKKLVTKTLPITYSANVIVSGSAIIKSGDWKETIGQMKAKCS